MCTLYASKHVLMKIEDNKVVSIHYTLKDADGNLLDSSDGRDPLAFIHGTGALIPGLEKELAGKGKGDALQAVVSPDDAYGPYFDELVHTVPKSGFQGEGDIEVGMQVQVETNTGPSIATVTEVVEENVKLDLNHPLAGVELHFDVEVVEVRDATSEELEHGHAHGPGGHEH